MFSENHCQQWNGTLLADKYNIPIIPISPYNPSVNGIIERGHSIHIESIWKITEAKYNWKGMDETKFTKAPIPQATFQQGQIQ